MLHVGDGVDSKIGIIWQQRSCTFRYVYENPINNVISHEPAWGYLLSKARYSSEGAGQYPIGEEIF